MSFDMNTLITDRTAADAARVKALTANGWAGMTEAERAEWLTDLKGAYNASDMNRVSAAVDYLAERLHELGYSVPGYARVEIQRTGRLPAGYTEVEYIESSGMQYINTGFKPNNNTRTLARAQFTATTQQALFGARTAAGSKNYTFLINSSGQFRSDYNTSQTQTWSADLLTLRDYDKDGETTTVDGTAQSYTNATFQCDYTMALLALNSAGTVQWYASARLYSCQIYDDGTLVRDFVPCTNADGTAGLYDLAGAQFYANAGSGTFTVGSPIGTDEELDPYTWYQTDAPTEGEAAQYLGNVAAVRKVLAVMSTTPTTPESMAGLTVDAANDIEQILLDVDALLTNAQRAWYFSGELYTGEV